MRCARWTNHGNIKSYREEIFKIFLLRYQSNVGHDNFSLIPESQVTIVLFTESRSAHDRPRTVCCELISQFVRLYLLNPVILLISSLAAINNEMMSRVIKWVIVSICQEEELQKERGTAVWISPTCQTLGALSTLSCPRCDGIVCSCVTKYAGY